MFTSICSVCSFPVSKICFKTIYQDANISFLTVERKPPSLVATERSRLQNDRSRLCKQNFWDKNFVGQEWRCSSCPLTKPQVQQRLMEINSYFQFIWKGWVRGETKMKNHPLRIHTCQVLWGLRVRLSSSRQTGNNIRERGNGISEAPRHIPYGILWEW